MREMLTSTTSLAVLVFAVSSMLSVSFGHDWRDILGPLRNLRKVMRAAGVNFVLVPLFAYLVLQVFALERSLAIGLFLVGSAAGAPFLIKLVQAADSDVALSTTLLIVLLPGTIVTMPIVVPLALPDAQVSARVIATPLVLTMLLPLVLGLAVRAYARRGAMRLQPLMGKLSTAALLVLIAVQVLANLPAIVAIFRTPAIIAALVLVGGALAMGYVLGGPGRGSKEVLGLGSAQRNIAAATLVATQAVGDPDTLSMVIVTSLAAFALLFPVAGLFRRRRAPEALSH